MTNKLRETCAILAIRMMMETYAEATGRAFSDCLLELAENPLYDAIFDFGTGLWKEGPDFLVNLYQTDYKNAKKRQQNNHIQA